MKSQFKGRMDIVLGAIILIAFFSSCSDQLQSIKGTQQSKRLGEEASLKETAEAYYALENGDTINLKVIKIEDSRCPEDVVCIWAGQARVSFQINDLEALYQLCLGAESESCTNTLEFTNNGQNYLIKLVEVTPYPNTTRSDDIKTAVFVLTEL